MRSLFLFLPLLLLGTSVSNAFDTSSVLEPNHIRIESHKSKEKFEALVNKIADTHLEVFEKNEATLSLSGSWNNDNKGYFLHVSEDRSVVKLFLYGGAYRVREPLAFLLSACSGLSRVPFLHGAPTNGTYGYELQGNYLASAKCAKRVMSAMSPQEMNELLDVNKVRIDHFVKSSCDSVFKNQKDLELCYYAGMGAYFIGEYYRDTYNDLSIRLETPSQFISPYTTDTSSFQCQLDSYFQGALCDKSFDSETSTSDYRVGTCTRDDGYTTGVRPLCWFKP